MSSGSERLRRGAEEETSFTATIFGIVHVSAVACAALVTVVWVTYPHENPEPLTGSMKTLRTAAFVLFPVLFLLAVSTLVAISRRRPKAAAVAFSAAVVLGLVLLGVALSASAHQDGIVIVAALTIFLPGLVAVGASRLSLSSPRDIE